MKNPLVSVIVTTKNNSTTIEACLSSIKNQTYRELELIVVDNHSTDNTQEIANKFTEHVYEKGPERSAQRNFGVEKAKGEWALIIDSDMELTSKVVEACVEAAKRDSEVKGVIIPEESFGVGFWAQCKKLEKSYYVGIDWIEAARFYDKGVYQEIGGFDSSMSAGEDWDLSQRVRRKHKLSRIKEYIKHNEGHVDLWKTLTKKYQYAKNADHFLKTNKVESKALHPAGPVARFQLFFSKPKRLLKNPKIGFGLLLMKTGEYGFGGVGYFKAKRKLS